jgi:hypothetical protein
MPTNFCFKLRLAMSKSEFECVVPVPGRLSRVGRQKGVNGGAFKFTLLALLPIFCAAARAQVPAAVVTPVVFVAVLRLSLCACGQPEPQQRPCRQTPNHTCSRSRMRLSSSCPSGGTGNVLAPPRAFAAIIVCVVARREILLGPELFHGRPVGTVVPGVLIGFISKAGGATPVARPYETLVPPSRYVPPFAVFIVTLVPPGSQRQ